MIEAYCTLIIKKIRPFDMVIDRDKAAVEARLLELGYDTDGNLITDGGRKVDE